MSHVVTASEVKAGIPFKEGQNVGGLLPIITYVSQLEVHDPNRDNLIVMDAGNALFGSFESNIFPELNKNESSENVNVKSPMVELMNTIGYDVVAVGNRDFEFGANLLKDLADPLSPASAQFDLLGSNVFEDGAFTRRVPYLLPFKILERGQVKIGIIGTLTPEATQGLIRPAYLTDTHVRPLLATWEIEGGSIVRDTVMAARANGANIVVVVADVEEIQTLTEAVSGVDVFIPRHVLGSEWDQDLIKLKTGSVLAPLVNGNNSFGRLDITYDPSIHHIVSVNGQLIWSNQSNETVTSPRALAALELLQKYQAQVDILLKEEVGFAKTDIYHPLAAVETPLGDIVTDAMRKTYGVDLAFINTLAMRNPLPAGTITRGDIYRTLIFDNKVITMKLRGTQILGLLYRNGFQNYRFLQVSGLRATWATAEDGYPQVLNAYVGNDELNPDGIYTVATIDFLAEGGDGFVEFQDGVDIQEHDLLNEIIAEYIKLHSPLEQQTDERMTFFVSPILVSARQRAADGLSALYQEGRIEEGLKILLDAHNMNPQDQAISYALGEAVVYYLTEISSSENPVPRTETQRREWARIAIAAIEGSPYPWAHVISAKIYLEFNQYDEARDQLLLARNDLRYAAEPNLLLGNIYALQGECEVSEHYYESVINTRNDLSVEAQVGSATCWCKTNSKDRGLNILKEAKAVAFLTSTEISKINIAIRACER